ncbi:IclR family transcriptional regulator [Natronorubrum halophilum]|uniref:IclR family transcriptional regulator n=1 Tax=Natronorubrum halophilum TaxID=1702106 RepID=UPI0010C1CC00|nr:IclR family transcriptional regulator [Natronorubrum halophilum]
MSEAKNPVQAVQRTLDIIDVLRKNGGARIIDIADAVGMSKGSVHCHLATLEQNGYAVKEDNEYKLGLKALDLAHHAKKRISIYDLTKTEVDTLAEETGELVLFTVEENGEGVCLYTAGGEEAVDTGVYRGYRNELYHTAVGKAMLAFMPPQKQTRIIEETDFEAITPNTITNEAELRSELEEIREEGIAYNHSETINGLVGVSTPICDQEGAVYGAISVIGPDKRMGGERLENEIPEHLERAVNIIEINSTSL